MARVIMIQGTASNVGKSLICAALCRIFAQDGYRVAPFKAQNMALNSFITADGKEMGRAQVVQAEAAGIAPDVRMNPILLKPTSDQGTQVIVNGAVLGNKTATAYYAYKKELRGTVADAYHALAADYDIIVIEGAGSPAEINLKKDDFVNMGMAEIADAPVLLVGDIDRGGVFAALYGTLALVSDAERARIKGFLINKFRGDVDILKPGLTQFEEMTGRKFLGVIPYKPFDIDDEDSLSERLTDAPTRRGGVQVAVVRLPKLANFTDFNALGRQAGVQLAYASNAAALEHAEFIILPGSKNTIADLLWLRQNGMEAMIQKKAAAGTPVLGICGGYQMLGERITDAQGAEGGGTVQGMGLLPVTTAFEASKRTAQVSGTFLNVSGALAALTGCAFDGYEIHMGRTVRTGGAPLTVLTQHGAQTEDGCQQGSCYGTYVHGILDDAAVLAGVLRALCPDGVAAPLDAQAYKQQQYDMLADTVRAALDMDAVYRILGGENE